MAHSRVCFCLLRQDGGFKLYIHILRSAQSIVGWDKSLWHANIVPSFFLVHQLYLPLSFSISFFPSLSLFLLIFSMFHYFSFYVSCLFHSLFVLFCFYVSFLSSHLSHSVLIFFFSFLSLSFSSLMFSFPLVLCICLSISLYLTLSCLFLSPFL